MGREEPATALYGPRDLALSIAPRSRLVRHTLQISFPQGRTWVLMAGVEVFRRSGGRHIERVYVYFVCHQGTGSRFYNIFS